MTIYDELVARGLIAQVTDEEEIKELAEHIWKKFGCPAGRNYVTCGYAGGCKDCWLDWLQQPAEG